MKADEHLQTPHDLFRWEMKEAVKTLHRRDWKKCFSLPHHRPFGDVLPR
jgi:hypothetical protein